MIRGSPCYFGVIVFFGVFEHHTMRLFASLQLLGGSGLMKMIVGLGGSYQSITLRRHKFRQLLFMSLECFGSECLRDVDYTFLQHAERNPHFGIHVNIFLNLIVSFVHTLYLYVYRYIKPTRTHKNQKIRKYQK